LRGSRRRAAQREYEGLVLFAGQKPYPTWRQALPPPQASPLPDEPGRDLSATGPASATSNDVVPAPPRRSLVLPIVLGIGFGVAALGLVGFLMTLTLRPALAPPKTASALPALEAGPPPLAVAASDLAEQTIEPEERLSRLEPPPIQIGPSPQDSLEASPPRDSAPLVELQPSPPEAVPPVVFAPLPPSRPLELAPPGAPPTSYDQSTAVYDISAHAVYLPDGMRLEAHSGLGDRIDDPRFVDERDHGATPPGVYQLTLRESLFHGVQALRLTPISGGFTFNRVGLLAHPYMLGPNGDSNGCVSFKNYDVFLRTFQSGGVKRLAVVAQWAGRPRQFGLLASLRQTPNQ
jgi:hypothetical protein